MTLESSLVRGKLVSYLEALTKAATEAWEKEKEYQERYQAASWFQKNFSREFIDGPTTLGVTDKEEWINTNLRKIRADIASVLLACSLSDYVTINIEALARLGIFGSTSKKAKYETGVL